MPDIKLSLIKPNPYRDFELHPYDANQIERLKASIDADGFWASVLARKVGDRYELAFGHHRIEAARQLGRDVVPLEVRDLSDLQMVRMLASENATQRGSTAAACLDAVAAISKVLAYNLLRWENEATFVRNCAKVAINFPSCRGRLEAGSGIGHDCVLAFAPKNAFTEHQVSDALGILKDSGRMGAIVAEAHALVSVELEAEREAAEQELAAAQRREDAAKTKREREAAAKETTKAKRKVAAKKAVGVSVDKALIAQDRKPIIFDARCAQLFKVDAHLATFRKIVTGETVQSFLPLHAQFDFATSVLQTLRERSPGGKEITARDIRVECWSRIESGLGMGQAKLRTAPERPYLDEVKEGLNMLRRAEGDFRRGVAILLRGLQLGERMDAKQLERLAKYEQTIAAGWTALQPYRQAKTLKLIGGGQDG